MSLEGEGHGPLLIQGHFALLHRLYLEGGRHEALLIQDRSRYEWANEKLVFQSILMLSDNMNQCCWVGFRDLIADVRVQANLWTRQGGGVIILDAAANLETNHTLAGCRCYFGAPLSEGRPPAIGELIIAKVPKSQ